MRCRRLSLAPPPSNGASRRAGMAPVEGFASTSSMAAVSQSQAMAPTSPLGTTSTSASSSFPAMSVDNSAGSNTDSTNIGDVTASASGSGFEGGWASFGGDAVGESGTSATLGFGATFGAEPSVTASSEWVNFDESSAEAPALEASAASSSAFAADAFAADSATSASAVIGSGSAVPVVESPPRRGHRRMPSEDLAAALAASSNSPTNTKVCITKFQSFVCLKVPHRIVH